MEAQECCACGDTVQSPHASITGPDTLCKDCLEIRFELAVADEELYPVKLGQQELDIRDFHSVLSRCLVHRFTAKEKEYLVPRAERMFCTRHIDHSTLNAFLIAPRLTQCGAFIGQRIENPVDAVRVSCEHCGQDSCLCCGDVHTGICERVNPTREDTAAFEGLVRGLHYQICPNKRCGLKVELKDGCSELRSKPLKGKVLAVDQVLDHVECSYCKTSFCYICGEPATGISGHWNDGLARQAESGKCPRFNQPLRRVALRDHLQATIPNSNSASHETSRRQEYLAPGHGSRLPQSTMLVNSGAAVRHGGGGEGTLAPRQPERNLAYPPPQTSSTLGRTHTAPQPNEIGARPVNEWHRPPTSPVFIRGRAQLHRIPEDNSADLRGDRDGEVRGATPRGWFDYYMERFRARNSSRFADTDPAASQPNETGVRPVNEWRLQTTRGQVFGRVEQLHQGPQDITATVSRGGNGDVYEPLDFSRRTIKPAPRRSSLFDRTHAAVPQPTETGARPVNRADSPAIPTVPEQEDLLPRRRVRRRSQLNEPDDDQAIRRFSPIPRVISRRGASGEGARLTLRRTVPPAGFNPPTRATSPFRFGPEASNPDTAESHASNVGEHPRDRVTQNPVRGEDDSDEDADKPPIGAYW